MINYIKREFRNITGISPFKNMLCDIINDINKNIYFKDIQFEFIKIIEYKFVISIWLKTFINNKLIKYKTVLVIQKPVMLPDINIIIHSIVEELIRGHIIRLKLKITKNEKI